MMLPPIFITLQASAAVRALLGARPRVHAHGEAPQDPERPYAVWQVISGVPENTLGETPAIDNATVQIDCYAKTPQLVDQVATAIRDQMETVTHMTAWRNPARDDPTRLYRLSLDFDYWLPRES